jgi:hypothetical protein
MPQITKSRVKQILEVLGESYFTSAGFNVVFPDEGRHWAIATFLDDPKYVFHLNDGYRDDFKVEFTPGNVRVSTEAETKDFNDVLVYLKQWTKNIKDELAASSPLYDELENLKKEFAEKLNEHVKDSQQHFTKNEVEGLEVRLKDLAKNFDELREQQIITAHELKIAKDMLEELQANLTKMPKKTWYRTAGSKIIEVAGKYFMSEQGQKLLGNISAKLLSPPK